MRNLAIFILGAFGVAIAGTVISTTRPVEAAPYATMTIGRSALHCNGDSTAITIHGQLADGTLLANVPVFLGGGTFRSRYGVFTSDVYPPTTPVGYTDAHGDFHARFAPISDGFGRWYLRGSIGDTVGRSAIVLTLGACDFANDTTYTISGELFYDRNANGTQDPRERTVNHTVIGLGRSGSNGQSFIPTHNVRTDRSGEFGWTGLFEYEPIFWPRLAWQILLPSAIDGGTLVAVSVNGVPLAEPTRYIGMPLLLPGDTHVVIGVQRVARTKTDE